MLDRGFAFDFPRLAALYRYGILDTPPDPAIDRIMRELRAKVVVASVQLVFVDDTRLWAKATAGLAPGDMRKQGSLAELAIEQPGTLLIDDIGQDPRAADVGRGFGDLAVRAYAAAPLRTPDQHAIGVISVGDPRARSFSPEQVASVERAALAVMEALEERRSARLDASSGAMIGPAFDEMVNRVGSLATRHRREMSVLVIDIDPFRAHVETFKADLGRLVIERMSALGRVNVRRLDSFGRLSENVFAVLLPGTGAAGARSLARRLSQALSDGWSAFPAKVPIGVGLASLRSGPLQPSDLVAQALAACQCDTGEAPTARPRAHLSPKVA